MVKNNHKENEKIQWKNIEEGAKADGRIGLQGRMIHPEMEDLMPSADGYTGHEVDVIDKMGNACSMDLGDHYLQRMQEAMEEWYSKPREGSHVSDITLCPRLKVFQKIDRVPIDAKTLSIYSAGKAIHEAIQWLFLSDKRTFEREKYIEYQDIQGSVDIYDRRRNIPLEFKTTRASDIKEPKSFHVEQLKYYMAVLEASEGYMLYQLLMHFGETPFKTFRITMNAQQRQAQREKLVKEIASLTTAMEARDPSLARSIEKDPSLNWLCKDCPYLTECKKIQQGAAAAA